MAYYDITVGPNGARYIDAADLPVGVDADSSLMLACVAGNGKVLSDMGASEKAFGRIDSTQDVVGVAGTAVDFSTMSGAFKVSAGTFGAGGYTNTQAGKFRVRVQLAYSTSNVDYCSSLRLTVNGTPTPAVGTCPSGLTSGSVVVEDVLTLAASDVVGALNTEDDGDGSAVNLIAHASTFYIERLAA